MHSNANMNISFTRLCKVLELGSGHKVIKSSSSIDEILLTVATIQDEIHNLQNIQSIILNWTIPYKIVSCLFDLLDAMKLISSEFNTIPIEYSVSYFHSDEKNVELQSIIVYK